ncbi:GNAT family N-acetyltransferase [Cetobacterium sp.]|uniref:GNAT family N-acetyltransferase n=1 Tax=Cetobacterium sp. TaxID=2071632 RepID=UPI003F35AD98
MLENRLKKMWRDLFQDDIDYINWYFERVYKEKTTGLFLEDQKLIGMLYQNYYHIWIDRDRFLGRYLVGLGVTPEKRGEGVMKSLLLKTLKEAYEYGEEFLYLTPIDKNIYERFGFGFISKLSKYELPFFKLEDMKKIFRVEKISEEEYDEKLLIDLKEFYAEISKDFYISVAREKEDYKKILSEVFIEEGIVYLSYDISGKINGYMSILKGEKIVIKELLFKERAALESLLSVIYGYKDYATELEIILPENTYLEDYFKSENNLKKSVKNKVQARILRVEKVLLRLSKELLDGEEIAVYVQDDHIVENTGVYSMKKDSVQKIKGEFDISLKIRDLAIMAYGFRDFNSLKKIESFYIKNKDKEHMLSKMFKKRINYFNQDF